MFTFGFSPQPTYTISAGAVNVVDTIETGATSQYQGFGIYFSGNPAGTDCLDASRYSGISFTLSGSLMGAGCAMQFSINDSEHAPSSTSFDPKAAGPVGSYAPQLSLTNAELTSTATTIMVPFAGTGAPVGGSPPTPIDPSKLISVQWWMSTPVTSNGEPTECVWNVNLSNVSFY
ncbi:MAG TPA: hypothetical protein VHO06_28230 [Polyangia bacterium]|nr:hypothetical protein [Polyangia bacterium]